MRDDPALLLKVFLLTAIALGGSGAAAPLHNLVVELLGIAVLLGLAMRRSRLPLDRPQRLAVLLLALIALTPLVQLIPLPHGLWSRLPGRDLAAAIDGALGPNAGWRPLSLHPEATLLAAAYVIAPAAMFLSVLQLARPDRERVVALAFAGALLSLVLGGLQLAGAGKLSLYSSGHNPYALGFFINRNHQADMHLLGILLGSAVIANLKDATQSVKLALWLTAVVGFSAGVIATTSRMGLLLLPVAILGSLLVLPLFSFRRRLINWLAAAAMLAVLGFISTTGQTARVVARFGTSLSDNRIAFWEDAAYAAGQYFPWGAGVGAFDAVFRPVENLANVGPYYVNHAHNDYLQIIIEAGAWGGLLLALFLALFGWLAFKAFSGGSTPSARAAALSIAILLAHSLVDYPLRILSLLTLLGLFAALLMPFRAPGESRDRGRARSDALNPERKTEPPVR